MTIDASERTQACNHGDCKQQIFAIGFSFWVIDAERLFSAAQNNRSLQFICSSEAFDPKRNSPRDEKQRKRARWSCDFRYLLILVAIAFIYTQVKLFVTQSKYAEGVAAAVEAENHCRNQMRLLIGQISMNQ